MQFFKKIRNTLFVMRKLLIVVFFYFIGSIAKSQNLTVEGTAPDLYIIHIVAPKENFYSISRLYNQPPKTIAALNNIVMEKGLTIGQHVKIPLNAQNFDSDESSNAGGARIPLTRIVAQSETLFKIGTDLHVTAKAIRSWNHLTSDKIAPGSPLIVGYLNTNNAAAATLKNSTAAATNANTAVEKNVEETGKQISTEVKKDDPFVSVSPDSSKQNKQQQTKASKQDENVQSSKDTSVNTNSAANVQKDTAFAVTTENAAPAPAKEEPVKKPETQPTKKEESKKAADANVNVNAATTGTFEEIYTSQALQKKANTKSGEAATFKSTSGWQDKKYYVLMNDVTPGTIVKVSLSDNKAVYAKVLGSMPEMKENTGLLLRISNAAASSLGIIDPKFPVQISYYQ